MGPDYRPWLTVRTKGLNSSTWRPHGKSGRTHHILNNVAMAVFMLLDRSPMIVGIREHFPLLPLDETRNIAAQIGVPHPRGCPFKDTGLGEVDVIMTTDFLVDLADRLGLPATVAISVKRTADLNDAAPLKLKSLLNKAEIERRYWTARKVPFLIITESDAPSTVLANTDLLHRFSDLKGIKLPASIDELSDHLLDRILAAPALPAKDHGAMFDAAMRLPRGTGISLIWHCIAARRWAADLTQPLDPASPLPLAIRSEVLDGPSE